MFLPHVPIAGDSEGILVKLAAKLIASLALAVVAMLTLEAYVSVQRNVEVFESDMRRDANQLGRTLKDLTEDVWKTNGQQRAMQLIEEANEEELLVSVRWVWLDATVREEFRPRASSEELESVRAGNTISFSQHHDDGAGFLYTYVPLEGDSSRPAALELAKALDGLDKFKRDTIWRAIALTFGLVGTSVVVVLLLGFALVGRPLHRLIEKTRRVGMGDLSMPLELSGRSELTELATALNQMCDQLREARNQLVSETDARIAALEQLRHADRLATVGRLAAGVAHELGTPMNVTTARAGMILEEPVSQEVIESAQVIKMQIDKMTVIIRQLLDFARNQQPNKSAHNVYQLVTQAAEMVAALARNRNIQIEVTSQEDKLTAQLDGGQFQQVVTNLLENAIQAIPNGGRVEVDIGCNAGHPPEGHDVAARCYFRMQVRDDGVGIEKHNIRHVFDPFFTTKDVGEGTGLGLSIAYGIVREHGGWIDVTSEPGSGSCFSVLLPLDEGSCKEES